MPCELIECMAACDDCRNLAVDHGINLIGSLRPGADPRDWGLPLTTTRIHLDDHLVTAYAAWLPERQPDCGSGGRSRPPAAGSQGRRRRTGSLSAPA